MRAACLADLGGRGVASQIIAIVWCVDRLLEFSHAQSQEGKLLGKFASAVFGTSEFVGKVHDDKKQECESEENQQSNVGGVQE